MAEERTALFDWMRENVKDSYARGMAWRPAAIDQMNFFGREIAHLFAPGLPIAERERVCRIEGFHTSKSIDLPVYYIDVGTKVVARDNFYNWNVTIAGDREFDIPKYLDVDGGEGYLFMEGMQKWLHKPYREDRRAFSFCVWNRYHLFAIMMCIAAQAIVTPAAPASPPRPAHSDSA